MAAQKISPVTISMLVLLLFAILPPQLSRGADAVDDLLTLSSQVNDANPDCGINDGIKNSLREKLENAASSLERDNDNAAIGKIGAFINEVSALAGKKICADDASSWITQAEAILEKMSGGDGDGDGNGDGDGDGNGNGNGNGDGDGDGNGNGDGNGDGNGNGNGIVAGAIGGIPPLLFEGSSAIDVLKLGEEMTFAGRFFDGSKPDKPQIEVKDVKVTIHLLPSNADLTLTKDNEIGSVIFTGATFSYSFTPPVGDWKIIGRVGGDPARGLGGGFWANHIPLVVLGPCRIVDCIRVDGDIRVVGGVRQLMINLTNNDKNFRQDFTLVIQTKDPFWEIIDLKILRGYTLLPGESHEGLIVGVPAGFTEVFILTGVDLDIPLSRPWR